MMKIFVYLVFYIIKIHCEKYKIGLLAPMKKTYSGFSGMTSASAADIAIETINSDPIWNAKGEIELRLKE